MAAIRPEPTVLTGDFIRLEPLTVETLPELLPAIGHPEVFAGGYGGGPAGFPDATADFVAWGSRYYQWERGNPFIIRAIGGDLDGVAIGTSTLGDFDETREHAHIGWTAYDPRLWGSQVNAEAKLLLLGHAFDSGFGRVKIQTDILNDRSRAAVLGLGASFEGITRRDILRADGTWRDTAVYSILVDEWPGIRDGLVGRLAKWAGKPVAYRDRTDGSEVR
jgi:RimJ/RimL family protein N-acetyltransferase